MTGKRNSFAITGVIILTMVMGLGLMGVGVSYWSESLIISGTVDMGTVDVELSEVSCYTVPSEPPVETSISCDPVGNVLGVAITNAQVGVDYYCDFNIENMGTLPVKIQNIVKSGVPTGVTANVTDVFVGQPIDNGQTVDGTVHVYLPVYPEPGNPSQDTTFDFTVTFSFVIWNQ